MKLLCVLLPHFPWRCELRRNQNSGGSLQRSLIPFDKPARFAPISFDQPAIVTCTEGSQKLVTDFSPGLDDLLPDMPLQAALARHGDAAIIHADIPYYWAAFNQLLDRLEQVSPMVEGPDLGTIYLGMDGMHLMYPDDGAFIAAVRGAVADFAPLDTMGPLMGIASNKFLASLAARYSSPPDCRILDSGVSAFLKGLSCDILPVSMKSRSKLHDFGLATLGQVAAIPSGPCRSQFGPEGKRIWELARGEDDTPFYPRYMEENIEESAALSSVTVSLDVIIVAIESLLGRLFDSHTFKGKGIRSLTVWTRTWNAEHWEKAVNFKEPSLDVRSTISRIKRIMEDYPQPGPVEQAGLHITGLGYPRGRQKSLFRDIRAQEHLAEDIKQLELKLGTPQVYTVKEVEPWSRIPERRYALMPANR
jgi:DNA polymerase-4/protein ImuB